MEFGDVFKKLMKRYVIRRRHWARGIGLAFYQNELWYTKENTLFQHCSKLSEVDLLACDWEVSDYEIGNS